MAELPQVVPGEPIQSTTFGNPVIERVISRYTDATERDFLVPLPQAGDPAYLTSSDELQIYDGSVWVTYAVGADYVAKAGDSMSGDLDMTGGAAVAFLDAHIVSGGGALKFVHPLTGRAFRFYAGDETGTAAFQIQALSDDGVHFGADSVPSAFIHRNTADGEAAYSFSNGTTSGLGKDGLGTALYGRGVRGVSTDNGAVWLPDIGAGNFPDILGWRASDGLVVQQSAAAFLQPLQDQIDTLTATVVALQAQVDAL